MAIERILAVLARILIWMAAFFLAAMMVQVFADVALKLTINQPIYGTTEIVARYYMVAAVFLPMPYVELRNSGISVDLFYNKFGPSMRRATILFAYLGQTLFFSLLAYQSALDAWEAFRIGEYLSGQVVVTVWPASFFLPLGFGLASLVSVLRIVQILTRPDWEQITQYNSAVEADRPVKDMA